MEILDTFLYIKGKTYQYEKEIIFLIKTPLKIIGFFASIFTGALIVFHFYLGYTGKTTSEFLKFPDKNIKSWNFRKEIIGKLCKKKHSSIIKIRLTEIKKFSLVKMNLDFEYDKKNKIFLKKRSTCKFLKVTWKLFIKLFVGFYIPVSIWYQKKYENNIFRIFLSFIGLFKCFFELSLKTMKVGFYSFFLI